MGHGTKQSAYQNVILSLFIYIYIKMVVRWRMSGWCKTIICNLYRLSIRTGLKGLHLLDIAVNVCS